MIYIEYKLLSLSLVRCEVAYTPLSVSLHFSHSAAISLSILIMLACATVQLEFDVQKAD